MELQTPIQSADPSPPVADQLRLEMPRWRRHLRWWLAAGVVVLLLALVPPLVNANRYQRQIAHSMSLSLGRPVHLDNVAFHLLPVPGLTLSNLVVSEDPAFGSEPTIRANTVEATLRLGSLWRRRVEFSTVRFVEPSINLVRNTEGRWNLANVLLHASRVTTAPTAQRRVGPEPRFPYIEATGGRVNLKLGEEKLPFSFIDSDFALWQPSPHQWRVRLRGQPNRTDANVTDPGLLRIEGDLLQATADQGVRISLQGTWHDAPLGQASLLIGGFDMGWRGTLNLEASLAGTLSEAQLKTQVTLGGLRRAEFAPAHPLDLQITCGTGLSIETVSLEHLACGMPDDATQPMTLTVPSLNLQHPELAGASVTGTAIPTRWALLWAGLFSAKIPSGLQPSGTLDVQLSHIPEGPSVADAGPGMEGGGTYDNWTGSAQLHLPAAKDNGADDALNASSTGDTLFFSVPQEAITDGAGMRMLLRLQPAEVHPDSASTLQVSSSASTAGYTFSVSGTADAAGFQVPVHYFPQLGDGLDAVQPRAADAQQPTAVNFSCSAAWGGVQECAPASSLPSKGRPVPSAPAPPSHHR